MTSDSLCLECSFQVHSQNSYGNKEVRVQLHLPGCHTTTGLQTQESKGTLTFTQWSWHIYHVPALPTENKAVTWHTSLTKPPATGCISSEQYGTDGVFRSSGLMGVLGHWASVLWEYGPLVSSVCSELPLSHHDVCLPLLQTHRKGPVNPGLSPLKVEPLQISESLYSANCTKT